MNARIRAICRPATALGFALSGVAPIEVADAAGAMRALDTLSTTPARGGVVLIESALYDALSTSLRRRLRREGLPILMPFPSPSQGDEIGHEQELLEVLRRAIGYRVRLR